MAEISEKQLRLSIDSLETSQTILAGFQKSIEDLLLSPSSSSSNSGNYSLECNCDTLDVFKGFKCPCNQAIITPPRQLSNVLENLTGQFSEYNFEWEIEALIVTNGQQERHRDYKSLSIRWEKKE